MLLLLLVGISVKSIELCTF